jgi:hypothetical protein
MKHDCKCPDHYEDRQASLGYINKTVAGWDMIREAMGETLEAQQ